MKILKLKRTQNKNTIQSNTKYVLCNITLSLIGATLLIGFTFSSSAFANGPTTSQSNVSVNVPNSCTLSGQIVSAHTATIANGTNRENIGTTKMKIYCNDAGGYTVYAIGASNDKDSNTNLITYQGWLAIGYLTAPLIIASNFDIKIPWICN